MRSGEKKRRLLNKNVRDSIYLATRGAFLRGSAALSGLGKRVGDADSVRGGTGALVGELGTHAFVIPGPNTLGAFGTAVGFASGVTGKCMSCMGISQICSDTGWRGFCRLCCKFLGHSSNRICC